MNFDDTVFRSSIGADHRTPLYDIHSKRVPIDTREGKAVVENLLIRERVERRKHFLDRGIYGAKVDKAKEDGKSGLWAVVDFTGKYHRPLLEVEPRLQIPGRALHREDERPTYESRRDEVEAKVAVLAKQHEVTLEQLLRRERTKAAVNNYQSGPEQNLRGASVVVEKMVMLAEQNLKVDADEEKSHAVAHAASKARPAETEAEILLTQAAEGGREQTIRKLLRVDEVACDVGDPVTGRNVLHHAWTCWEEKYGFLGGLEAVMKDDPRYGSYRAMRDMTGGVPAPAGHAKREPLSADAIDSVLSGDDGRPKPNVGPKAQRAKRAFEAAAGAEYIVALALEASKKQNAKTRTPWRVRDFVNAADCEGRTPLHCAAERGHAAVLHELLLLGGDLTLQNHKGETPIAIAAARGQVDCLKYLTLKAPVAPGEGKTVADRLGINLPDNVGRSPINRVFEFWRVEDHPVDAWGDAIPGLGTAGVDRGMGPLGPRHGTKGVSAADLIAAGHAEPVKEARKLDASLLAAQVTATCSTILLLARAGAEVKRRTRDGRSTLHEAVRRVCPEAVRALLAFGADTEAKDEHGLLPLDIWRKQQALKLSEWEAQRRVQIGNMLRSWHFIAHAHEDAEFYGCWRQWLADPEVRKISFVALEEAFRAVRLDELVLVKLQNDRNGKLPPDPSWAAWAKEELQRREDGGAPVMANKSEATLEREAHEASLRLSAQEEAWKVAALAKGKKNQAKRRWGKIKLLDVKLGGALQSLKKDVKVDPLEKGRKALTQFEFGKELLPAPDAEAPIKFTIDSYVFSTNPKQRQMFSEPHKPDPYREVPLLEKGMEVTQYDPVPFPRPNDLARYRTRRAERQQGFMEDAVRQETIKVPSMVSVLGGTRWLAEHPNRPPVVTQARPAVKDMDRHDFKVAGIKKYVELMGETLKVPADLSAIQPFQTRPDRDLNATTRPLEVRTFHGENKKQFADSAVLPKFPLLTPTELALRAASMVEDKKAARRNRKAKAKSDAAIDKQPGDL